GTPVVSTDCPSGPAEILANGEFGTLVPVGEAEALSRAMDEALARPHASERLRAHAHDFTPAKAAKAYLDLLFSA
ncbi:MAG TPA: glycosyltransferase, partial [Sphingomonadaceae bacterium]|nr:glycosyltransferase [Sphingomonadaceae bacterium]